MFIAFALEGVAMMLWLACREDPLLFVLLSGVVSFGWGEIFSLFPSTLTDTFGSEHAASKRGWLYIFAVSGQSLAVRWRHCSISTLTAGMWSSAARLALILSPPPSRCGC